MSLVLFHLIRSDEIPKLFQSLFDEDSRFDGSLDAEHGLLGRLDQRIWSLATGTPKVIVVNSPEHDSSKFLLRNIESFLHHSINIIKTNTNKPPPQDGLASKRVLPSFHLAGSNLHSP